MDSSSHNNPLPASTAPDGFDGDAASADRPLPIRYKPPTCEHWTWLILSIAVIVLSFVLKMRDSEKVGIGSALVLPNTCLVRIGTGYSCPGCGLTRSFLCLARGDLAGSWHMHRLGWFMAILVIAQIPYRIYRLVRPQPLRLAQRMMTRLSTALVIVLIGNWLLGLLLS